MKKTSAVATLVLFVMLAFSAGTANAVTSFSCQVTQVGYNNDSTGKFIYITCSGRTATFMAYISGQPSGCSATDIDSLKLWETMASSAELSGRTMTVWYNLCGSGNTQVLTAVNMP